MALNSKRKVILVKAETTYGTDAVPVAGTDGVLVKTAQVSDPIVQASAEREIVRPFLGSFDMLVAGAFAKVSIEMEIAGFGSAGPAAPTAAYDALLRACGLSSTVTVGTSVVYAPVSSGFTSVTAYIYQDGTVHKLTGCFGDLELSIDDKGVPTYKITLTGLYVPVADAALPSPTLTAYVTPVIACADNTTPVSIFGYAGAFKSFSLKFGNQVEMREYPGGSKKVLITDRKSSGSIEMESSTVAVNNPWSRIAAATPGAISVTHGTVAGNKVTFAVGRATPYNPKFTDDQNLMNVGFDFTAPPSLAGNDDFSITVA